MKPYLHSEDLDFIYEYRSEETLIRSLCYSKDHIIDITMFTFLYNRTWVDQYYDNEVGYYFGVNIPRETMDQSMLYKSSIKSIYSVPIFLKASSKAQTVRFPPLGSLSRKERIGRDRGRQTSKLQWHSSGHRLDRRWLSDRKIVALLHDRTIIGVGEKYSEIPT